MARKGTTDSAACDPVEHKDVSKLAPTWPTVDRQNICCQVPTISHPLEAEEYIVLDCQKMFRIAHDLECLVHDFLWVPAIYTSIHSARKSVWDIPVFVERALQ